MFLYFTQYQWMWKMYSHKKIISCKFTNSFYWKYKVWSVQTLRIKDQPNQKPAFSFVLSLIHWGRVFCLHIESSVTELSLTDVHHGQFVAAMPFHICKPYLRSAVSTHTLTHRALSYLVPPECVVGRYTAEWRSDMEFPSLFRAPFS